MAASDELAFRTLDELEELLARRAVSSLEMTHYFLDRLERLGRPLNAIATLMPDLAIREATRADRLRTQHVHTPVLGIPYGAKDLLAARGAPTTYGSPAFAEQVFDFDAGAVDLLGRAGAPLAAKLALSE